MKKIIIITGPTASGKTSAAVETAKLLESEIISADARQMYKCMSIATAVPDEEERGGIRHHFMEFLEPEMKYNAAMYGKEGRELISKMQTNGIIPVIAGGSGLYIKSLIDGLFDIEIDSEAKRKELNDTYKLKGKEYMHKELAKVDPESAERIAPGYYRRVIRALEVFYSTGERISDLQKRKIQIDFNAEQYGILFEREKLYERINNRTDVMIEKGLINEVKNLLERGLHWKNQNSLNTVGIKEVMMYLENEISFEYMVSLIKQHTRNYSKRQMTWFKKDERIKWIDAAGKDSKTVASEIVNRFRGTEI